MSTAFRQKNQTLYTKTLAILEAEQPITLRGLFYRAISAGLLANSQKEYKRLGRLMTAAREAKGFPFAWIVDHVRSTLKPSSWTGLADFGDTVRHAYRKDLWAQMPHHVVVFVEKDAIAGTVQPVTAEYDIALQVCRGYASLSFVGEIASEWEKITKPIFAYYLGDHDPSGFDIERDLQEKLARYSNRPVWIVPRGDAPSTVDVRAVYWTRLAVDADDFALHDLIRLPVKLADNRTKNFLKQHGEHCAEVDALAPTELRHRVREAIERHVEQERWAFLKHVEHLEQQTLLSFVGLLGSEPNLGSLSGGTAGGVA